MKRFICALILAVVGLSSYGQIAPDTLKKVVVNNVYYQLNPQGDLMDSQSIAFFQDSVFIVAGGTSFSEPYLQTEGGLYWLENYPSGLAEVKVIPIDWYTVKVTITPQWTDLPRPISYLYCTMIRDESKK